MRNIDESIKKIISTPTGWENTAVVTWPVEFVKGGGGNEPHVTVAFFSNLGNVTKDQVLDALRKYKEESVPRIVYYMAKVYGVDVFGPPEREVPVLKLFGTNPHKWDYAQQEPLVGEKNIIVSYLDAAGLKRDTKWDNISKPWSPHVTVSLRTALNPPEEVLLRPLELWWEGKEKIVV